MNFLSLFRRGRNKAQQQNNAGPLFVQNAISWNKETHPNGAGPSYLVEDINWENGGLDVKYRDGFTAHYDNVSEADAKDFLRTDSKGRWAHAHLWNKPYTEV